MNTYCKKNSFFNTKAICAPVRTRHHTGRADVLREVVQRPDRRDLNLNLRPKIEPTVTAIAMDGLQRTAWADVNDLVQVALVGVEDAAVVRVGHLLLRYPRADSIFN